MVNYKLTYFNARFRAEVARLCFAVAEVKYEDNRIDYYKHWGDLKNITPLGGLPILEVDDKVLCQAGTINRYLGREFGLIGSNNWEAAKVDEITSTLTDLWDHHMHIYEEKDPPKKAILQKKFDEQTLPKILTYVMKNLQANGNNGFLVGDKVTVADLATYDMTSTLVMYGQGSALGNYAAVKSHMEYIGAMPAVEKWVESRPKTEQ